MDRTAKKHLMAIPVQPYTGDGSAFARVYTEKDILMLHLWNNGEFKGRHLVDKAGKYVAEIGGAMCIKKLEYQLNSSQRYECGWLDVEVSEEDEKTAHTFFGEYNNIGLLINRAESWYNKDQYSRKMDRKIDRINAKMALFEEQEEKIKEWYLREITPWEYAFKADGVYYCTACGETHTGDYKHLQRLKCSGKMVTVMTRTKVKEKSDWVTAFSRQADGSLAERLYKVSILWSRNEKMVDIKETIRWVWMPYQPGKVYYRQWGETWWDTNPCNRRWDASYLYPEQAEEVLRKSGYEATQLWDIGKAELPINWIMKRKTPVYAQLCLTGLAKLAQQDAAKLNYYSYGGKIDLEGQTPEEVLGLDKNAIGRLKQLNGGTVILEWLQWKAKHPKAELKTETLKELERKRITPSRLGVMANLMSPRKCLNFLSRQEKLMNDTTSPVITYYEDYISIARKIGMDIRDEIVYAPKNLKLRHDQLVDEYNRRKSEFEAQEMDEKWPGAQEVLDRIKDIYNYQGDGWQIITPQTLMDIVDDSHQLHHCAGASGQRRPTSCSYAATLRRLGTHSKSSREVQSARSGLNTTASLIWIPSTSI
nr:MAG TPA: PcfJ like protein [Caudoviricetes sp.]